LLKTVAKSCLNLSLLMSKLGCAQEAEEFRVPISPDVVDSLEALYRRAVILRVMSNLC
jgi:hypothetical protein